MSSASDRTERSGEGMTESVGPDVTVPGPYPSDQVSDPADTGSQSEPTKATRGTKSFGEAAEETSTSVTAAETGGLGSPTYDDQGDREN
jgi:hypothetical protein